MEPKTLEMIKSPDDIKSMNIKQLSNLADEIRQALIVNLSNTGGHLASNLGVVELTIAIHKVFDSPHDKIVFDVGHQCYVHKMLTGRYGRFDTLRQKDGLSGFPNPEESEHDIFKTGHSSTSISSALGLSCADSLKNSNNAFIAVIGDGSMTGGLAYEGLNNAGNSKKNVIVILNDNNMCISQSTGAVSKMLTRLRNRTGYFAAKDIFENVVARIPCIGKLLYRHLYKIKSAIKTYYYSSNIFESMGFKYMGPVDGHNIELLLRVLNRAKSIKGPILIHTKTKKGKGYTFAESKPGEYHGVGEFDINTGTASTDKQLTYTDVFGNSLIDIAKENKTVCAVTAAMGKNCGLYNFSKIFPERYFDVGIAEGHAVTFASGLAKNGMLPVFAVYSTFLQRSYDQIIHDVSLQKIKMIFAVDRAGIVGADGETHQGMFDIPMILPIPGIKVFSPSTSTELEKCLYRAVYDEQCSCFIRYPKGNCVYYTDCVFANPVADWDIIKKQSNSVVISYGEEIHEVLSGTSNLSIDIIKLNLINIFDEKLIAEICGYKNVFFIEECYKIGGVGSNIQNKIYSKGFSGCFYHLAIDNEFIKQATQAQVRAEYGIDAPSIRKYIIERIK